jgi:hypothetical protein
MNKPTCCAHLKVEGIWFCCELEKGHIGRHQDRRKQDTKDRNWLVMLWDADMKHPSLCPRCAE